MKQVVVVCTRDRSDEVLRCLASIERSVAGETPVWVVDASANADTEIALSSVTYERVAVSYEKSPVVGLARQRNYALELARRAAVDVVHFLDDDARVLDGYFDALLSVLDAGELVAGAGGVVLNEPPVQRVWMRALFGLYGRRPGRILKSGRVVFGHVFRPAMNDIAVEWLPGCCMSYRLDRLGDLKFDARLEGYSWGEDFDFSNRLYGGGKILVSCGRALCVHDQSERNRWGARRSARERTLLLHRWIYEQRHRGYSRLAFWWSVVGELVMSAVAVRRPLYGVLTIIGLCEGAARIAWRQVVGRRMGVR